MLAPEFFKCGIDNYPVHPSFKRTFILVMDEVFKYLDESLLQDISCLIVITGILKAYGI